jgi:hypothetical protein
LENHVFWGVRAHPIWGVIQWDGADIGAIFTLQVPVLRKETAFH